MTRVCYFDFADSKEAEAEAHAQLERSYGALAQGRVVEVEITRLMWAQGELRAVNDEMRCVEFK